MQHNPTYLLEKTEIKFPLIGFYDVADTSSFDNINKTKTCVFAYYKKWEKGKSILLTKKKYGCPGAGTWLCDIKTRSEDEYVKFLKDDEGLKANHDLMRKWLNHVKPYKQENENIILGPLNDKEYDNLKTVTFFVNPDQLSILMIGAQLFSKPEDSEPVIAPFGSGCMQLISLFNDLNIPQAIIGATDMAMRKYIPPNIMAFTVTKPMYERLCLIGKDSYLEKGFLKGLKKARKLNFSN